MRRGIVLAVVAIGLPVSAVAQEGDPAPLPEELAAQEAADRFGDLCFAAVAARAKIAGGEMDAEQVAECALATAEAKLAVIAGTAQNEGAPAR